jgi:hypothetical protein
MKAASALAGARRRPPEDTTAAGGWPSAADLAELDVLCDALVSTVWRHRQDCLRCALDGRLCARAREALAAGVEVIEDWKRRRLLRSRALAAVEVELEHVAELRARAERLLGAAT